MNIYQKGWELRRKHGLDKPWNKGKKGLQKHTEKWKKEQSKIMKGHTVSDKAREKLRKSQMGSKNRMANSETKEKMRQTILEGFKNGRKVWNKNLNGNNPYSVDWTASLKRSIRERDKYRCRICGEPQGDISLDVHHIDYNKKNCNPDNLISLCHSCHLKTNSKDKSRWIKYFQSIA